MVCIYCGRDTKVINSRLQRRNNQIWRRRKCTACGAVFTTNETTDYTTALSVATDAGMQPFLYTKLLADILAALTKRDNRYVEATEITNTVIRNLLKQKTSATVKANTISLETAKVLKRFDKQSWHRYWAEHLSA